MIPFVRMFNFGNIIQEKSIKSIDLSIGSNITYSVLLNTGEGYVGGYNATGQLGIGNKTNQYRKLLKIDAEISHLSCSGASVQYITTSGEFYVSGSIDIQNPRVEVQEFVKSDVFSALDLLKVRRLVCNVSTLILMEDGKLYGVGLNRYGELGSPVGFVGLKLISEDVLDCSSTGECCAYIKTDGTVWAAGRNRNYFLKSSTDGGVNNGVISTFVQVFAGVTDIHTLRVADGAICGFSTDKSYNVGTNSTGCAGDGNTSVANTNPTGAMFTVQLPVQSKRSDSLYIMHRCDSAICMYVGIDDLLYSTGNNHYRSLGLGVDTEYIGVYTVCPGVVVGSTDIVYYGTQVSYIGSLHGYMSGCGRNEYCISTDSLGNKFNNLPSLPWLN